MARDGSASGGDLPTANITSGDAPTDSAPTGNALAGELSPYLLQHAGNPVAWLPWGEEAFRRARELDRPILLSIGYSSCHWCHVMARESFEDHAVAALMNASFVNVKVDREERPDVDAVYMRAVQALTGSGGWPLTAVLTPDGRPFYCGTYFPPVAAHGLPAFTTVLQALSEAWRDRRQEVEESADAITQHLREAEESARSRIAQRPSPSAATAQKTGVAPAIRLDLDAAEPPPATLGAALPRLEADEDRQHGGFGGAPKFPPHALLAALLAVPEDAPHAGRAHGLARRALGGMLRGGIRDHLGGGFFRYSVDAGWRVPHFEKMLYDNAQMLANLAAAHARLGGEEPETAARELCAWLERELTLRTPAGAAFLSALDADSESPTGHAGHTGHTDHTCHTSHHEEGAYYTWSNEELSAAAGAETGLLGARFGVGAVGELEGRHVLRLAASLPDLAATFGLEEPAVARRLADASAKLSAARERRPRPATDDKVLSSWNGLMLRALAAAGTHLAAPELHELALANARFLRHELYREGRLHHVWRAGASRVEGLLEDYAFVGLGLIELYRATPEPWLLSWAFELADAVQSRFAAPEGGFYSTASDAEALLTRPLGVVDGATPSENAAAAELVWWVGRYRTDAALESRARDAVGGLREAAVAAPHAFVSTLALLDRMERRAPELVVVGEGPAAAALLEVARELPLEDVALLHVAGPGHELAGLPLLTGRLGGEGSEPGATAYLCVGGACRLPARSPAELRSQLAEAGRGVW